MIRRASGSHPERGALINAAATASAHRVETEEALARCSRRPEKIADRILLEQRLGRLRAEEAAVHKVLDAWEMHVLTTTRGGGR